MGYIISVCSCCMIAAVNAEPCQCDENALDKLCLEHPAGLMGKLDNNEHAVLLGDKSFFSWTFCDGCGSTFGGERYEMAVYTS